MEGAERAARGESTIGPLERVGGGAEPPTRMWFVLTTNGTGATVGIELNGAILPVLPIGATEGRRLRLPPVLPIGATEPKSIVPKRLGVIGVPSGTGGRRLILSEEVGLIWERTGETTRGLTRGLIRGADKGLPRAVVFRIEERVDIG